MALVLFPAQLLRDYTTGEPLVELRGAVGTVTTQDSTVPVELFDINGLPIANPIAAQANGHTPPFWVEGLTRLFFRTGAQDPVPLFSPVGLYQYAEAAALSAEESKLSITAEVAEVKDARDEAVQAAADATSIVVGDTDTVVSTLVLDEDSATRAAISQVAPSGGGSGSSYPELFGIAPALLNADTERVTIALIGDSLGAGQEATAFEKRLPRRLQARLNKAFSPDAEVGLGYVPSRYSTNVPAPTGMWTYTGTVGNQGRGPAGAATLLNTDAVASATFRFSKLRLFFSWLDSNDAVSISIDGTTTTFTRPSGSTRDVWESDTLTDASHTVTITRTAGRPIFCGGEVLSGTTEVGVAVVDLSVSGMSAYTRTHDNAGSTDWPNWIGLAYTPDMFVINLLGNDVPITTAAEYAENIQTMITWIRARTAAPILLVPNPGPNNRTLTEPWDNYLAAARTVAKANTNVAFHNLSRLMQDPTGTANPWNIFTAGPHMNDRGQNMHAAYLLDAISPVGSTTTSSAVAGDAIVVPPPPVDAVLTSDSFSGDMANVNGRTSDALLGGTGLPWVGSPEAVCAVSGGQLTRGAGSLSAWFEGFQMAVADYEITFLVTAMPTVSALYIDARRATSPGTGSPDGYRAGVGHTGNFSFAKRVAGTNIPLGTTLTYAIGDRLGLRVKGNQISLIKNGASIYTVTDTDISAAGFAGVAGSSNITAFGLDDVIIKTV